MFFDKIGRLLIFVKYHRFFVNFSRIAIDIFTAVLYNN